MCDRAVDGDYLERLLRHENPWEIGVRGDINLGDRVPSNDLLGGTFLARHRLNDDWTVGGPWSLQPMILKGPISG
jgi:hypothetical protein